MLAEQLVWNRCDKVKEVCKHHGSQNLRDIIKINIDLQLSKMISPLSYILLILSPSATSNLELATWHHNTMGVPWNPSSKRLTPEKVLKFGPLDLELVIEDHRFQIWKQQNSLFVVSKSGTNKQKQHWNGSQVG